MKKIILSLCIMLTASMFCFAQPTVPLKKTSELKMPKTADDDMCGTRGASVVWNPLTKKYYAVFAGNAGFPLAVFDATAKRISSDDLTAYVDTRALWFDPVTKKICGNGYSENGWFTYKTDAKGIVTDYEIKTAGQNQPDAQSAGAYNPLTKKILFLHNSLLHMYNNKQEPTDSMMIHWGRKKADGPADGEDAELAPEDYNSNVVFTGVKGKEIGFLNITNKEIELYDIKTGYLTQRFSLPETAKGESFFNFAYTNNTYWLFDMEQRVWKGYR